MISKLIAQIQATPLGTFDSQSSIINKAVGTDSSGGAATKALESIISEFIALVTVVGGIALIFYFVTGALAWITANGDTGKTDKARMQMIQAVTGMVIVVAAYGIIGVVSTVLGLHLLTPGQTILDIVKSTKPTN